MVESLTKEAFLEKVFNYEESTVFKYVGKVPAIIDFYADWCVPCKTLAPILDSLSSAYEGKIKIYKIDTEAEQELSAAFGIRSIPSMLFCPIDGDPQMANGALPKHEIIEIAKNVLKVDL